MLGKDSISLIFPCYNEEKNFHKGVIDEMKELTEKDKRFKEIIIVDDGSSDNSRSIIRDAYMPHFPKLKLIENNHQGKAFALITGIKEASGQYVLLSDMDLATPLSEADKLITQANNEYKIIIGSRSTRREGAPIIRKIMSTAYIYIRSLFVNLQGVRDTQCGFKLYEREAALRILDRLQVFKRKRRKVKGSVVAAGFDLEFLFIASKLHYKIKEVPVIWHHVDTENVLYFVQDGLRTLKDILLMKYYDLTGKYNT